MLDISSEVDQQDLLVLLQAKVVSLTLHNKELQDKLQARAPKEAEADQSFDSFHSTQTDLAPCLGKTPEASPADSKSSPSALAPSSSKSSIDGDVRTQQLQETLQDLQRRLESSETERKQLQAELQARRTELGGSPRAQISENGSDLSQKLQDTQHKYEEAMQEVLSVQHRMKLGLASPEGTDTYACLREQRISEAEVDGLKQDLQEAREESERYKEKVRELEERLGEREQGEAKPPAEEDEETKRAYRAAIESVDREKALLFEKYQEAQEEIARLKETLASQGPPEAGDEAGDMKEAMSRMIDELNKQVSELSQLYKEAQAELEDYRKRKSLDDTTADYIHKAEHESLLQAASVSRAQAEEALADMKSQYSRVLHELTQLKQLVDAQKENSVSITEHLQVVTSLRTAAKELEEKAGGLKEQLTGKEAQVATLEKQLLEEKAAMAEAMVPRTTYEKLQASLESEVRVLASKLKDSVREKERSQSEAAQARAEASQLKRDKDSVQGLLRAKEQEAHELVRKCQQAQEELAETRRLSENLSRLAEEKDKEISEMSKEVTKLKEALNSLSRLSYSTSSSKRQSQQLDTLQQQVKQLQNQLAECKKQHQEVISVYRMHLLYAVQGQMDEDVQKVLKQILTMCKHQSQKK